jgi:aconitate hydratase
LLEPLERLGFHIVGQGCMTCIGNSGALLPEVAAAVEREGLAAFGVLSGNRNFDGRVNAQLAGAYLASPPLVVAWAIAGSVDIDLSTDPLGHDAQGRPVRLADLWPDPREIEAQVREHAVPELIAQAYRGITEGDARWRAIAAAGGQQFDWDPASDYIRRPPYFDAMSAEAPGLQPLQGAAVLLRLGDDVTTDHISPAGGIAADSLAGRYLIERGTLAADLNQYSTRRSNHEVMLRGAFGNPRLRNELADPAHARPGRQACDPGGACVLSAWEAAEQWREARVPLMIFAGQRYGAGSSRDWAAKAPALLGVRAVVAGSFERIHRSNLLALGVLPLTCVDGQDRTDLCRDPAQRYDLPELASLRVGANRVRLRIHQPGEPVREAALECRIESRRELDWLRQGGVLPAVVRRAIAADRATARPRADGRAPRIPRPEGFAR